MNLKFFTNYFFVTFTLIYFSTPLIAQQEPFVCGWNQDSLPADSTENTASSCFDVNEVFNNCELLYISVNMHFFTDTDCIGDLQVANTHQSTAYEIAENLIEDANEVLADNQIQWHDPNAQEVCNPLRYVLKGVYIHCRDNAIAGNTSTNTLHTAFGVNVTSEINVYIADHPGPTNGVGLLTFASIDWIEKGNFNHEIGHVFTLAHSFINDACDDTPPISYFWDKDCDGNLEVGETNLQCWGHINSFVDHNQNATHDCEEIAPCTPHPCCSWDFVDNNVMSYNAYKSSYTECQIKKMLFDLSTNDCNYIAGFGDCPPPSAFITQTPLDVINDNYCAECIVLGASCNDDEYRLQVFEIVNSIQTLVYDSGWSNGPVDNFCFTTNSSNSYTSNNYLEPNTEHRVFLAVKNSCNEQSSMNYYFTTPGSTCTIDEEPGNFNSFMRVIPNPFIDDIQIEFYGDTNEIYNLFITNMFSGSNQTLVQGYTASGGLNVLNVPLTNLSSGSYTITLLSNAHLFSKYISKL